MRREAPRAARPLHVVAVALAEGVCRGGGQRRIGGEQLRQRLRQQAARAVARRAAREEQRLEARAHGRRDGGAAERGRVGTQRRQRVREVERLEGRERRDGLGHELDLAVAEKDAVERDLGREPARQAVRRLDEQQLAVRVAHRDARVALLDAQLEQQPHREPLVVDTLPEGHAAPQVHLRLARGQQWRPRCVAFRVPQPELKGLTVPHAALQPRSEPPADGGERGVAAQPHLGRRLLSSGVEEDVELESIVWSLHRVDRPLVLTFW